MSLDNCNQFICSFYTFCIHLKELPCLNKLSKVVLSYPGELGGTGSGGGGPDSKKSGLAELTPP